MFDIKKTQFITKIISDKIDTRLLLAGANNLENYIIYNDKKKFIIYDRNCDHAGGKILSYKNIHKCPYHNWVFDPKKGEYLNGTKKKSLNYKIIGNYLLIKRKIKIPKISKINSNKSVIIKYINHAFLIVENSLFKFATDPWAIGPAFGTGWWLSKESNQNWLKDLNNCKFIYISHNHPDHLHPFTLSHVRKDMLFLIPKFASNSVLKCLQKLNFKNILSANFLTEYNLKNTDLNFMLLKSGDFRDDSGILFSAGRTSFLISVDSNTLNSHNLPKVDVYGSSFAAGASGFPLVFENYNEIQKKKILIQNKVTLKSVRLKEIQKTEAKYFLPYAGSFDEKLLRDNYIKKNNIKNTLADYGVIENNNVKLLNIDKYNFFEFYNGILNSERNSKEKNFKDIKPDVYLKEYKNKFLKINKNYIRKYFIKSNFYERLSLYISLTNDNFKNSYLNFCVNFSNKKIKFNLIKKKINKKNLEKEHNKSKNNILFIKARADSFMDLILNENPWEDLSIGFQCRIFRIPNEYNARFWYHFSNIYIKAEKVRMPSACNACEILNQKLQKELATLQA